MSMQGKTVLVTGATDGLGKEVATRLAADGARVLLHGRDRAKGDQVIREIAAAIPGAELKYYQADLADFAQVRRLGEQVLAEEPRLDVLLNNAGIGLFGPAGRQPSRDGHELHFQVNYLAPFLLTLILLPALKAAAPSRIVNVASIGQAPTDFDDVMLERGYSGLQAYRQSKLAQITFTFDLAKRLEGTGVAVTALHPATLMATKMVAGIGFEPQTTIDDGATPTFRLAASPEVEGVTGVYFNQSEPARANDQAYDEKARERLWDLSIKLTGAPEPG